MGLEACTGTVTDLSFEGACVADASEVPKKGGVLFLTLRPERENVTLRARIVYVREKRFGVKFCGVRAENLEALKPFFSL